MTFADKLKNLMKELDLTQSKLSDLTGIGKSSISQYLSGKNEPSKDRKQEIARALGVQDNYFEMFEPAATEPEKIEKLFSKEQLLAAERFQERKDIVNALLSPDKQYTVEAVEQMIEKYMKGQVK